MQSRMWLSLHSCPESCSERPRASVMNPEERLVTWLISLGVLESPKKTVCDPEEFLKSSLKNGVVLCKLINRLLPGSVEKYCLEPQTEADCIDNINDFLKGCATLQVEVSLLVLPLMLPLFSALLIKKSANVRIDFRCQ